MALSKADLITKHKYRASSKGIATTLRYNASLRTDKQRKHIAKTSKICRLALYVLMGNKCVCCGENNPIYFHIDHVKNDGYLGRGSSNSGKRKYKTSKVNKKTYLANPKKFQILCANCNWAKHMNGGKLYKPKKKRKVS